jgi:hypothetical protein
VQVLATYYSNNLAKRSIRSVAKKLGFRSGLEQIVFKQIEGMKIVPEYESFKISYVIPASNHTYLPDFKLPNGIIVETKGRFVLQDRKKHLLIQKQYPTFDIRFVFSNSRVKISKGSKTTYADWCDKHGFKYADKLIPKSWFNEK